MSFSGIRIIHIYTFFAIWRKSFREVCRCTKCIGGREGPSFVMALWLFESIVWNARMSKICRLFIKCIKSKSLVNCGTTREWILAVHNIYTVCAPFFAEKLVYLTFSAFSLCCSWNQFNRIFYGIIYDFNSDGRVKISNTSLKVYQTCF